MAELLETLRAAAEDREAGPFAAHLADGFQGTGGLGKSETVATVRRYFAAYESIDVDLYELAVERTDGSARARFRVEFRGLARRIGGLDALLPPSASYRFTVDAASEEGTWMVTRADWELQAGPPAP